MTPSRAPTSAEPAVAAAGEHRPGPARGRRLAVLGSAPARALAGLLVLLIGSGAAVAAASPRGRPQPAAAAAPYAVGWYCPVLPGTESGVLVTNPATTPAVLYSTVVTGAGAPATVRQTLPAGAHRIIPIGSAAGYVELEATGAPVVPTGQPACAPNAATHWWIAGGDTRNGAVTRLVVANPGNQDAVVQVMLHTASGPLSYPWLQSRVVAGGSALLFSFPAGHAAAALQPAIEVSALTGRVIVGAAVTYPAPVVGRAAPPRGSAVRSVAPPELALASQPVDAAATWFIAGSGAAGRAALLVGNLGQTPLDLDATVLAHGAPPQRLRLGTTPVLPGATATLPLPVAPAGPWALSLSARDAGPVVATLLEPASSFAGPPTTGLLNPGVPGPERNWLLPALGPGAAVLLANPGRAPVAARVSGAGASTRSVRVVVPPAGVALVPAPAGAAVVAAGPPGVIAGVSGRGQAVWSSLAGGIDPGSAVEAGPVAAP